LTHGCSYCDTALGWFLGWLLFGWLSEAYCCPYNRTNGGQRSTFSFLAGSSVVQATHCITSHAGVLHIIEQFSSPAQNLASAPHATSQATRYFKHQAQRSANFIHIGLFR
jgi:hypothetical protein